MKARGFTLIEILVAIGIMLIVASLLLPVFNRTRESAYKSRDASNLRQIAQALALYIETNGGGAVSGTIEAMGLPRDPFDAKFSSFLHRCSTGKPKDAIGLAFLYTNFSNSDVWSQYTADNPGTAVLVGNLCWVEKGATWDVTMPKYALGAHIDTHVSRHSKAGDWTDFTWWH